MNNNSNNINDKFLKLIEASMALANEKNVENLLENILKIAKKISNADGGTLYVTRDDKKLHFSIILNSSLDIHLGGSTGRVITYPALKMVDEETGTFNRKNAAAYAAINKETLNIADIYTSTNFDFQGVKAFDAANNYKTKSMLILPMKNREGKVIAVIQLINAMDENKNLIPFDNVTQTVVEALASQATIVLEFQNLLEEQKRFIESFVDIITTSIEKKSFHTNAHCKRVPILTRMLTAAASMIDTGALREFELSDEQWYALHIGSWLHDCGKLNISGNVLAKSSKLECMYNRIHEIRTRFEVLIRDAEIEYLKKRLESDEDQIMLLDEFNNKVTKYKSDFAFIAYCNTGEEPLSEIDKLKLKEIAQYTFTRNLDNTKGLAREELSLYGSEKKAVPTQEHILQNAMHHMQGRLNYGELYNLLIDIGTLTPEEKQIINEHVELSMDIVGRIPFPNDIKADITDYVANHHERLDGSGYPRGLKGNDISIPARIIAIADTFEALTATDRPYKSAKSLSQTLDIMKKECEKGTLDYDVFELFITSGVMMEYAKDYMQREQIDIDDFSKYLRNHQ